MDKKLKELYDLLAYYCKPPEEGGFNGPDFLAAEKRLEIWKQINELEEFLNEELP